jgi:voltage-gated potassium channel
VDERSQRVERVFAVPVVVAALLVIPVIAVQESHASQTVRLLASIANWIIWLVFAAELVAMLWVAPNRRAYLVKHPLDVAIVVFTPPFLPPALQALRVFRLLRLTRLFKAAGVLRGFFSLEGLRWAAIATAFVVVGGGAAFASVEKGQSLSIWDGFYWAITTVTTIGSSITPDTTAGRMIEIVVLLTGIGFIAMLTGALAQQFIGTLGAERERDEREVEDALLAELRDLRERLERIEGAVGSSASTR